jgi:hypothetical protein
MRHGGTARFRIGPGEPIYRYLDVPVAAADDRRPAMS